MKIDPYNIIDISKHSACLFPIKPHVCPQCRAAVEYQQGYRISFFGGDAYVLCVNCALPYVLLHEITQ